MKRRVWIVGAAIMSFGLAKLAFAVDTSSPNYQNNGSGFSPAVFDSSSANFQVSGSVDSIVGDSGSANFNVKHGTPIKGAAAAATPAVTGGSVGMGGGSGQRADSSSGYSASPAFVFKSPTFLSQQTIGGTRNPGTTKITVQGSSDGIFFPSPDTWQSKIPLFIGYNDVKVQGFDASGMGSAVIAGRIERMLIGDSNRDHLVDDVDISLLTRAWKKYNFFSDFNEDGKIDDADLSLIASHWGQRVSY